MHGDFDEPHFQNTNALVTQHHDLFTPLAQIPPVIPDHPLLTPITVEEVESKRKTLRNTAPGPDGISNLLIKKAPLSLLSALTILFNATLHLGYTPRAWKHAHVVLFPKPQKDPRNPNSYRPISLTSAISKLFEKVLTRRLHQHLNDHNLLPLSQAGFRPGFNMYDQLLRVVTCLQNNNSLRRPTIMALMDVQKAFDTVWHNGLRAKLLQLQLPPAIVRWISHFIDGRTAQVRVRGTLSSSFTLSAGVPQGSAISPLLYIIFVRDVPAPIPKSPTDTTRGLAQFADDTAFWLSSHNLAYLQKHLTDILNTYLAYCNRWRIQLNTAKTQLCFFNFENRRLTFAREIIFRFNGARLQLTTTCKYLGVTLDSKLTFSKHLILAKRQATTRIRALHILNNRNLGCSKPVLTRLYTSIIRPVLTYAHIFFSAAHDSYLASFDASERRALRVAAHQPPWSRNQSVYDAHDIPTLRDFVQNLNTSYTDKAQHSPILQPFLTPYFLDKTHLAIHHLFRPP